MKLDKGYLILYRQAGQTNFGLAAGASEATE